MLHSRRHNVEGVRASKQFRPTHHLLISHLFLTLHTHQSTPFQQTALKEKGVDEVLVYCVNDPAVMQAWAEDQGIAGSFINMMGDPAAELTKALDVEMVHPGPPSVGIIGRCKRFAMHVVDGEVKYVAISEGPDDPAGDDDPSASLAPAMLENI